MSRSFLPSLIVAAGLLRCSNESTGAESRTAWRDGLRLQAIRRDGVAPEIFLGWYDTQLQVECSFRKTKDGLLRCLPEGGYTQSFSSFADPTCTEPIVRDWGYLIPGCIANAFPAMVSTEMVPSDRPVQCFDLLDPTEFGVAKCRAGICTLRGPTWQVHRLGDSVSELHRIQGSGPCMVEESPVSSPAFRLGPQVPDPTFTAGRIEVEGIDARLVRIIIVGEDGSVEALYMHDLSLDRSCGVLGSPYEDRCVAATETAHGDPMESMYWDSECKFATTTVIIASIGCELPDVVRVRGNLHRRGPKVQPGELYELNPYSGCQPAAREDLYYYEDLVPPEYFAPLRRVQVETGTARDAWLTIASDGRPLLAPTLGFQERCFSPD